MADLFTTKLTGVTELKSVIDKLPQVLADKVYMQALRAGGVIVRDAAKAAAPVAQEYNLQHSFLKHSKKHGDRTLLIKLRDEIKITVLTKTDITYEIAVHVGRAFWGMFFEFGTWKMSAKPWLRPSFERTQAAALAAIGKQLGSGVEQQATKLAGPLAKSGLLRR